MKTIKEIAREQYETGAHGATHFRMQQSAFHELISRSPAPNYQFNSDVTQQLWSIPIVVDDELPEGAWRLVENGTGKILFEGTDSE